MNRFVGKTALVTGGGNGIGRATVLRLAREGAVVTILDRDEDAAGRVCDEAEGERHQVLSADVTDAATLDQALNTVEDLDVLVNNAAGTLVGSLDALDPQAFDEEIRRTLHGTYAVTHKLLPLMLKKGAGSVTFNASVNAVTYVGNPAYSAAKAGVLQLMRAIAVEYGPKGIRANAVSPGSIRTNNRAWSERLKRDPQVFDKLKKWYPVGRVGTPEDIANAIVFLASDEAAFVNGANLVVDGGLSAGLGPMIQEFVIEDD